MRSNDSQSNDSPIDELDEDTSPTVEREEHPRASGAQIMERNTAVLGPSDTSDSGADVQGEGSGSTTATGRALGDANLDADTDSSGTGERASAALDEGLEGGEDIAPNRIVDAQDAGLGSGLDQAEEAQTGQQDSDG
jgi:hypothetical protein